MILFYLWHIASALVSLLIIKLVLYSFEHLKLITCNIYSADAELCNTGCKREYQPKKYLENILILILFQCVYLITKYGEKYFTSFYHNWNWIMVQTFRIKYGKLILHIHTIFFSKLFWKYFKWYFEYSQIKCSKRNLNLYFYVNRIFFNIFPLYFLSK